MVRFWPFLLRCSDIQKVFELLDFFWLGLTICSQGIELSDLDAFFLSFCWFFLPLPVELRSLDNRFSSFIIRKKQEVQKTICKGLTSRHDQYVDILTVFYSFEAFQQLAIMWNEAEMINIGELLIFDHAQHVLCDLLICLRQFSVKPDSWEIQKDLSCTLLIQGGVTDLLLSYHVVDEVGL